MYHRTHRSSPDSERTEKFFASRLSSTHTLTLELFSRHCRIVQVDTSVYMRASSTEDDRRPSVALAEDRRGSNDNTREHVQLLQRLCESQDHQIRSLREPLALGRSAAHSTAGSSAVTTTAASMFHIRSAERPWNQQFQAIVDDTARTPFDRIRDVSNLLDEYRAFVTTISSQFLSKYFGGEDASVDDETSNTGGAGPQPNLHGDGAGTAPATKGCTVEWATAQDISKGEHLTISLLDCADSTPYRKAAHAIHTQYTILSQQLAHAPRVLLHVFPQSLVRLRGRFLLVTAEMLSVGETVTAATCRDMKSALTLVSESLNLASYWTEAVGKGREWGPPNCAARYCCDGRLYVDPQDHHGLTLMPFIPPAQSAIVHGQHALHFRPEVVRSSETRLSPAAFVIAGGKDSAKHNRASCDCLRRLCSGAVVELAAALDRECAQRDSSQLLAPKETGGPPSISALFHRHGVNIALSPFVLLLVESTPAKRLLVTHVVARVVRDHVAQTMSQHVNEDDVMGAVSEFFAKISADAGLRQTWNDDLASRLSAKFAGFATFFGPSTDLGQNLLTFLDHELLLRLVGTMLGIEFAKGVTAKGNSPFHYSISSLRPVVKTRHIPPPTA